MTNEEAISVFKEWIEHDKKMKYADRLENIEIYNMAIKALEQQPCEKCVSIADLLEFLKGIELLHNHDELRSNLIYGIMNLPSVTPQPKTGHWVADVDKWGDIVTTVNGYRCSECNTFNTDKDNYCHNCGAKMEVEE